ncbi:MAG: tryptophan 7-halogenase [Rhodospirillales bacterium]|nr:tryptophan 7-halogenase [Rhodospirillales bacterium]
MTESLKGSSAFDARLTEITSIGRVPASRTPRKAASSAKADQTSATDQVQCCDVLILGRGPAASAAALTATRLGLSTVMMAPRRPIVPTPAEMVPAGFTSALARIGVRHRSLCRQGHFSAAGRDTLAGWHVDRVQLDLLLLRAAVRSGARLRHEMPEAPIQENGRIGGVVCAGGLVRSRVLIDASGSAAWLRRSLGLRRTALSDPLIAARGQVRGVLPFLGADGMRFTPHPSGWTLMIAHDGLVSWTVLCTDGQHPEAPGSVALLPETIRTSHAAVGWQLTRPVAGDGWLIAGDAGGRIDPAGGSGLSDALASGARAAHAAGLCLQGDGPTAAARSAYDDWFAEMITQRAAELSRRYEAHGIRLDRHPMRRRAA